MVDQGIEIFEVEAVSRFSDSYLLDLFMKYFEKELSGTVVGYTTGYSVNGKLETNGTIELNADTQTISLSVNLVWSEIGSLERLAFIGAQKISPKWKGLLERAVQLALVETLNNKTEKFYRRYLFGYSPLRLSGVYYLPGFRIEPATPNRQYDLVSEQYLYMDLEVDAIDQSHANYLSKKRATDYATLLSVILGVGLYDNSRTEKK